MPITLKLQLITTASEIENSILDRCAQELNSRLNTGILRNSLKQRVRNILFSNIIRQPEYASLIADDGVLRTELGLVSPQNAMDSIMGIWLNHIEITSSPVRASGRRLYGNITLSAVQSDFADVLSAPAAQYITEHGDTIPWLQWLLLLGDDIIIATHKISYKPTASRTGGDIMVLGDGWKVPSEFSGVADNNFITRAIDMALPELGLAIESEIRSKI